MLFKSKRCFSSFHNKVSRKYLRSILPKSASSGTQGEGRRDSGTKCNIQNDCTRRTRRRGRDTRMSADCSENIAPVMNLHVTHSGEYTFIYKLYNVNNDLINLYRNYKWTLFFISRLQIENKVQTDRRQCAQDASNIFGWLYYNTHQAIIYFSARTTDTIVLSWRLRFYPKRQK